MTTLPNIGKPATNALQNIGITELEQLTHYSEKAMLQIHGVGPKAVRILKETLESQNLSFKNAELPKVNFAVLCTLNCENAPKKKIILDYLIAAAAANQAVLETLLVDTLSWIKPGESQLEGKLPFIKAVINHRLDLSSLEIQSILTHGREASAHGIITDKKGNKTYFSDVFLFSSSKKEAKIKQITSFVKTEKNHHTN